MCWYLVAPPPPCDHAGQVASVKVAGGEPSSAQFSKHDDLPTSNGRLVGLQNIRLPGWRYAVVKGGSQQIFVVVTGLTLKLKKMQPVQQTKPKSLSGC